METKLNFNPESLLNLEFSSNQRGYDSLEVDETLDKVIDDYKVLLKTLNSISEERSKHLEEISKLKKKVNDLEIKFAQIETQYKTISNVSGIDQDNMKLLKKISAYERVLYKKGIDPKKVLSDPDNC